VLWAEWKNGLLSRLDARLLGHEANTAQFGRVHRLERPYQGDGRAPFASIKLHSPPTDGYVMRDLVSYN